MPRLLHPNRRCVLASGGAAIAGAAALRFPTPALAQGDRPDIVIAVQALVDNFEPIAAISNVGLRVVNAIFDTLLYRDFLGNAAGSGIEIVPALATGIERIDPQRVRVTLRDDVLFHHGERMTAADVAFSFGEARMFGPEPMTPRAAFFKPDLIEVTAVDDRTVEFVTRDADFAMEKRLASWIAWVVPEGPFRDGGLDGFGVNPIGTGPFKLREFIRGDRIVLEANDAYWRGRPTARTITFVVTPETATRVAGLIAGDFDFACALSTDNLALLDRYDNVEGRGAQIENIHLLIHNQVNNVLSDKRIRQAMHLCIDREMLNRSLWAGMAGVTNGFQMPTQGVAYDPNRPAYVQDLDRARTLLAEAGYAGERISFRTLNDWYVNSVAATQVMQQWWQQAGLNVEIEMHENWGSLQGEGLMARNWSNGFPLTDPVTPLTTDWGPNSNVQVNYGWTPPEEYNTVLHRIRTLPDGDERTAAFQRALDIWDDEAPGTTLYRPYELYGVRRGIQWRPVTFEWMELRPHNLAFA